MLVVVCAGPQGRPVVGSEAGRTRADYLQTFEYMNYGEDRRMRKEIFGRMSQARLAAARGARVDQTQTGPRALRRRPAAR